ncbi:MAG TPA: hypothetical protein VKY73_04805 [Polyangiaceae bacterium]|nr:hypothetical protein [Polyangiaceae bacterium]
MSRAARVLSCLVLLACNHAGSRVSFSESDSATREGEALASAGSSTDPGSGGTDAIATGEGGLGESARNEDASGGEASPEPERADGGGGGVAGVAGVAGGSVERNAEREEATRPRKAARAVLARETLAQCSPKALKAKNLEPIQVTTTSHLGGCPLRIVNSSRSVGGHVLSDTRVPLFQVFTERERLLAQLACGPQRKPTIDTDQNTYAVFYDVIRSSEDHAVVFSVDDGESVHVGLQVRRVCQGMAPYDVMTSTVIVIPGPHRNVTLHRCAPRIPSCGPVP